MHVLSLCEHIPDFLHEQGHVLFVENQVDCGGYYAHDDTYDTGIHGPFQEAVIFNPDNS